MKKLVFMFVAVAARLLIQIQSLWLIALRLLTP